jgi:hypothetical protein
MRRSVAVALAAVLWCGAARAEIDRRPAAREAASQALGRWRLAPTLVLAPTRLLPRGLLALPERRAAGDGATWVPSVAPGIARTDGGFRLSLSGSF